MGWSAVWGAHTDALLLITADDAQAGDRYAITHGDSPDALMWRAAGHLARTIIAPNVSGYGRRVVIVAGKGNNGGDGYAAALRLTREWGAHVTLVALDGDDVALSEEASRFRHEWTAAGHPIVTDPATARTAITRADTVVDAVLGTGGHGPLRPGAKAAVHLLSFARETGCLLVACDLPTGVDADTGAVDPHTVAVHRTVTFGAAKQGLMLAPASAMCGQITVGSLGRNWDTYVAQRLLDPAQRPCVALSAHGAAVTPYPFDADKWVRGRVAVIGGVPGTAGAAALTAHGALRAGAGLVHLYAGTPVAQELGGLIDPAVMLHRIPTEDLTAWGAPAAAWLATSGVYDADVVVAGPGLGVASGTRDTVEELLGNAPRLVLDADALNVFREDPSVLARHTGSLVVTPHRKELARIGGGSDADDAWQHRMVRVPKLARRFNATIVAKGPGTLIAAPDGRVWITPVGSPAAGTGGSGDLLAGIIAAAIAGQDDVSLATAKAVWWHARASERAGARSAGRSTASDLVGELAGVFAELASSPTTL
jgi:ADP-dependent NAD(P)H-hydrate dehydratase / NAD(P)H-hydrate epimerase